MHDDYEDDDDQVQCWHIEPGTPCDWNVCNQPERLARGDKSTDPALGMHTPNLDRIRAAAPTEQRTIPADYLDDQRIDLAAHIPGYTEALAAMDETCTTFSEHGWGRCVEPRDHEGFHMYPAPRVKKED